MSDETTTIPAPGRDGADPESGVGLVTRSAGHNAPMTMGDRVRFVLRGVGQTLITLGLVVLLFVVYEVWVTNWFSEAKQSKVHTALEQAWQDGVDPLSAPNDQSGIPIGEGIANIYIPRLGQDYHFTIVQGTDDASLAKGPGHYLGTQLPGQVGNFAVAGHRVGKGEPFLNLDHLRPGDAVIIQTKSEWFVYRVIGNASTGEAGLAATDANGVPGREIVDPSDGQVLSPVPDHPDETATPNDRYMTMTTCHPKFTANQRMVVHAQLDTSLTTASIGPSQMPAAITALYGNV
jgi:sortase A